MSLISRLLTPAVALFFCAGYLFAQFDSGQIAGFVRDQSSAVVPGATVTATNEGTKEARRATTNGDGYYVFPQLAVGSYSITVEAQGFKRYVASGIALDAEAKVSVDVELTVGAATESVEVTASTAAIQTDSAQVATTIETKQMEDLTLNGRNPIYLAALSPGVVGGTIGTFDPDSVSNGSFNINGGRNDEYVVMIDGAVATRTRSSGSMVGTLDVDTVQEAQVLTGNYSAEYGRSSGGEIRFVTKSGTRDFHGSLVENFRNSALDANTWTRNQSPQSATSSGPAPYRFNQYGFTIGGPVFIPKHFNADRNKFFFFWGEEWIKRRYTTTNTGTVPSLAMRGGNFSELLSASNPFFGKVRIIDDPLNGNAPFAGNIIPPSRLSPNGEALLNIFPTPVPGFQQGTSNWIGTKPTHSDFRKDTYKFDYIINEKHHVSVRLGYDPWNFNAPFEDTFGRMEEVWSRPNRVGAASLTSTFSPTFINEFNFSANSDGKGTIGFGDYCTACLRSTYGLNYPYIYPGTKIAPEKVPSIRIQGLTTLDAGPYPGSWAGFVYAWTNTTTKVLGNHTIKWGVYIEHSGQNDAIQGTTASTGTTVNQNGDFSFNDSGGTPLTTGLAIANAALGNFDAYEEFGAKAYTPWVATAMDLFAQDSWKVTSKLSFEYGLRWSLWPPWHSRWGNLAEFLPQYYDPKNAPVVSPKGGYIVSGNAYDGIVFPGDSAPSEGAARIPALTDPQFKPLYHGLPEGLAQTQYKVFQPRIGVAYAITSRMVVRAGVGSFANRVAINRDTALGGNAPLQPQESVVNGVVDNPGGATPQQFPFNMTIQDPVFKIPTAWEWNGTFQREVGWSTTVQVGYVGRRGIHNQIKRNINQLPTGTLQANPGINTNALRPYLGMGVITISENAGLSRYDGLQINVQHRFTNNLQFGIAYTHSRSTDNGSSLTDVLPDAYNAHTYFGPSDFDRTDVLVSNYIYKFPFFKNQRNIAGYVLGGWEFSGIYQYQSGTPFSVRTSQDIAGVGTGSGNQFWNESGDSSTSVGSFTPAGVVWFNKAAFTQPAAGTFGVQPRNSLRNPSYWTTDASLRKNFAIIERLTMQFRFDVFDFLNHPNWGSANSNPTSGSFGTITGKTNDSRQLQLALKLIF
ncbi:MAG TPA: carboxypeptidase regulatory-like domain-containing protein [Bryobacteraceae bacterium]|nr:carboxypeptidase regulatory-like domain-containing protein [Bryobacteraceae bacterium]